MVRSVLQKPYQEWIHEAINRGAGEILLTAMHKDGTGSGFDLDLLRATDYPLPIIASGGANRPKDFLHAIQAGADAVFSSRNFFTEMNTAFSDVKNYLIKNNIKMRM